MASNDADQFLATQVKLIQSDAVLRPVAEKYKLLQQEDQVTNTDAAKAQRHSSRPRAAQALASHPPPNTYLLLIAYARLTPSLPPMSPTPSPLPT